MLPCSLCYQIFTDLYSLTEHMQHHHEAAYRTFSAMSSMRRHMQSPASPGATAAAAIHADTPTKPGNAISPFPHPPPPPPPLSLPPPHSSIPSSTSSSSTTIGCDLCTMVFSSDENLRKHKESVHSFPPTYPIPHTPTSRDDKTPPYASRDGGASSSQPFNHFFPLSQIIIEM